MSSIHVIGVRKYHFRIKGMGDGGVEELGQIEQLQMKKIGSHACL